MTVGISTCDDPPFIMLDGEDLRLDFDMGSRVDLDQEHDPLTAFLEFSLGEGGFACTAMLTGRNAAGTWLETKRCRGKHNIDPTDFAEVVVGSAMVRKAIVAHTFGKPFRIDLKKLREEALREFLASLESFDMVASCKWSDRGLYLNVIVSRFDQVKWYFKFEIPYKSAVVVLQDRRRKSA